MNRVPKLYLLTNDDEFEVLKQKLTAALKTGAVSLLQIRRKQTLAGKGYQALYREAEQIVALAQAYEVPVVMNDDIELAALLGIGVHLGQDDGDLAVARARLGADKIIGRTCHNDVALIQEAKYAGASYAAMGAVFPSTTKPDAKRVSIDQVKQGSEQGIDICVIGGLSVNNIELLKGLALTYVAVTNDIMNLSVEDIGARCLEWQRIFSAW